MKQVFLNQSKANLLRFNYPMIEFSNKILSTRCQISKSLRETEVLEDGVEINAHVTDDVSDACLPLTQEYPNFISTYTSGSFIVAKNNIKFYPQGFYQELYDTLYAGPKNEDRTCGILEYMWTTLWGGVRPFHEVPDVDRWCGPLYFSDISTNGFTFYKSEDLSVENGNLPEGYYGHIKIN
jgi:hypothetical protein